MKKFLPVEVINSTYEPEYLQPKPVEYHNAHTIEDAVSLLNSNVGEAQVIAGGVDLVHLIKKAIRLPGVIVNLKTIPGLTGIKAYEEGLIIGALTTINDIGASPVIREKYNLLAESAMSVAAPQVRNMATIGGNLCQEVRCWYYRRSPVTGQLFNCYRKGGTQCYAVKGNSTFHAIISDGECHASFPSDMAIALTALEAQLRVIGSTGQRLVPLDEFYTNLGNILEVDEIITGIQVPLPKPGTKQSFRKFRIRKAIDFAIASVAAAITKEDNRISSSRIVLGGIAPTTYRAIDAELSIIGKVMNERLAESCAKIALSAAVPLSMNHYKLPITEALLKRALNGS